MAEHGIPHAMKIISIQEGYQRKFARQAQAPWLELHANGHCAHIGKISPGCLSCFTNIHTWMIRLGHDVGLPDVCNRNCLHCFGPHQVAQDYAPPADWQLTGAVKRDILRQLAATRSNPMRPPHIPCYGFTGLCEPLFYMPVIREYMHFFREEIDLVVGQRGWAKIYTNGTLLNASTICELRDLGFDEVRVNPTASGFSPRVYRAIGLLVKHLPTVTVEVPVWPHYREQFLAMLPILADLGIDHLDLCQVEVWNKEAQRKIARAYPDAELYQGHFMMLDDGGLVEALMHEVVERKYPYSVIDCNAFVKQSNHSAQARALNFTDRYEDVFAPNGRPEPAGDAESEEHPFSCPERQEDEGTS
jgi:pyruvate formate-lyase activating enzyme-like uncharacterized protein